MGAAITRAVLELPQGAPAECLSTLPPLHGPHSTQKLIEVINQDFGDYVGLASRLNSVDGSVVRMKQPLLDIKVNKIVHEWGGHVAEVECVCACACVVEA
jgi:hypothetical protein